MAPDDLWDFSCPDWVKKLKAGKSLLPSLPLDFAAAEKAVSIFNELQLPDVVGQPRMAEAAGEWQRDIVRALFGSLKNGKRLVPEIFVMVPKKNSKTTGGAGIALTMLLMNVRPRAEMIFVAPTQEVAEVAFSQTVGMIEADPDGWLARRFHVADHLKTITDRHNKSKLKIKTFDMKVITGSKPNFVLLDELHLMSNMSAATRILRQIRGGLMPNPEASLVMITTQSDEPPAGVFRAELQFARGVRDGTIKSSRMLPILYEFPEKMQTDERKPWQDPKNWPMVLPNLGRSIQLDTLIADYEAERQKGDVEERLWASQHINVEVGLALHSDRWPGADYWLAAADSSITLENIIDRCDVACFGVDGGGLDDLLGASVVGRCKTTRDWLWWFRAWCQADVLKQRPEIAERLRDFEKEGSLVICKSPTQDFIELGDICEQLNDAGMFPEKAAIGLDPVGITAIVDELVSRGIEDDQMVAVPQGYRLHGSIKGSERKLADGTLWQDGSKLMKWCVGNAKQEQRGNAVLITKQVSGKAKIDPLIAGFNAVSLMSRNPEGVGTSVYLERGALVL